MSVMPQGDDIRNAVKWISEERQLDPEKKIDKLIEEACFKFNLSPLDAEFLLRNFQKTPL
jgi:hypothetical protein